MNYINWKYDGRLETVDEFEKRRDAVKEAHEYRMAFGGLGEIYISSRSTKEWRERK